jgi:hypothetical protein
MCNEAYISLAETSKSRGVSVNFDVIHATQIYVAVILSADVLCRMR